MLPANPLARPRPNDPGRGVVGAVNSTKIPADVDRPDKVMVGLTARQVLLMAATAVLIYLGCLGLRTVSRWACI